jgi:hypothetical protein
MKLVINLVKELQKENVKNVEMCHYKNWIAIINFKVYYIKF